MAKKQTFLRGPSFVKYIKDKDWITVINALVTVNSKDSKRLAKVLLAKTKHGRQIRLLRLIKQRRPRLDDMKRTMGVTRRTIFRDLNCLEDYGVKLAIDQNWKYEIVSIPAQYRRLL